MRLPLCSLFIASLLAACSAGPPPYAVQLAPLPPRPSHSSPPPTSDYLGTVRYIDAGVKYLSPINAFFVSPRGNMCFRGVTVTDERYPVDDWNFWCIDPHMVGSVEALANYVSYVPEVRLWCKHANPYCAERVGEPEFPAFAPVGMANSIAIRIVPPETGKAAIEHLVRLLGGHLDTAEPLN